jgi:acyl-CoA reductase-like NAD-dependent aldehyde dehydrogenase
MEQRSVANAAQCNETQQNGPAESLNTGKPYNTALSEDITDCIAVTRYYACFADKFHGKGLI